MGKNYTGRLMSILIVILVVMAMYIRGLYIEAYSIFFMVFAILVGGLLWYGGFKYDRAVFLAHRDPLTKVYNREYVYKNLPNLLKEADKRKKNVNILFVDIDGFKEVNDTHGHPMGDRILIEVANVLRGNVRESDNVIRWGGDEFLVLFPNCSKRDLSKIIQRIHGEIYDLSQRIEVCFSISIGISTFPNDGVVVNDLIKKADSDMYKFKAEGEKVVKII